MLVFWPGEFHGLYSPWGRKELDTTEQISLHLGYKLKTAPETSFTQVQIYICFNIRDDYATHLIKMRNIFLIIVKGKREVLPLEYIRVEPVFGIRKTCIDLIPHQTLYML